MSGVHVPAILVSLLPVAVFLAALMYMDGYRLVRGRAVAAALAAGVLSALVALAVNRWILDGGVDERTYSRYAAPLVEELCKSAYLLYLLGSRRIGFAVDAAIFGFTIGTGFAFVENITYLVELPSENVLLWAVRGFGTALMHGGATAMYAVIAREVQESRPARLPWAILGGFLVAYAVHSGYNHFFFSPVVSAILTVVGVPLAMTVVYRHSEQSTQRWLGVGFDTDRELYTLISTGTLADNNVGKYLHSLQESFPPTVVADMLCYLRTYAELAIGAKALVMMREAGLEIPPDPTVPDKLKELDYLRKSIGTTGLLALSPFVHTRSSDEWQLEMLKQG